MNNKKYIMSIDIGTQSVRAIVFDNNGNQIQNERVLNKPYYSLKPGWAEVPADEYWSKMCIVTNKIAEKTGDKKYDIGACAITANRDNIIPLDENGDYIRDWITWIDQRRVPKAVENCYVGLSTLERILYKVKKKTFDFLSYQSKFNWFKYYEPDTYERASKYLSIAGLATYKWTG